MLYKFIFKHFLFLNIVIFRRQALPIFDCNEFCYGKDDVNN